MALFSWHQGEEENPHGPSLETTQELMQGGIVRASTLYYVIGSPGARRDVAGQVFLVAWPSLT